MTINMKATTHVIYVVLFVMLCCVVVTFEFVNAIIRISILKADVLWSESISRVSIRWRSLTSTRQ